MLFGMAAKLHRESRQDSVAAEAIQMPHNIKGLLQALQQSINEAIMESDDVAAAMAALKRTGKCPVFTIDISMQDPAAAEAEPFDSEGGEMIEDLSDVPTPAPARTHSTEELVLSDSDVEFLAALGVRDPSWCQGARISPGD